MFWEPGAFQGFIMLPFLFYIGELKWLWENRRKQVIVLVLALFSTLSTTAYLVAFTFCFLLLMTSKLKKIYKGVLIVCALLTGVYAFYSLDFLGEKIQGQVETTDTEGTNKVNWSRTGALFIDLVSIARHPFVGNGFLMDSRYVEFGDEMAGTGNGLSGAVNMLGIP